MKVWMCLFVRYWIGYHLIYWLLVLNDTIHFCFSKGNSFVFQPASSLLYLSLLRLSPQQNKEKTSMRILLIVWLIFFTNLSANLFIVIFINNNWRSHIYLRKKSTSLADNAAILLAIHMHQTSTKIAHCNMHLDWNAMNIFVRVCLSVCVMWRHNL